MNGMRKWCARSALLLFTLSNLEFGLLTPVRAQPRPSPAQHHTIGPHDVLSLSLWDGEHLQTAELPVAEDGTILVPFGLSKTLKVEGLSTGELKSVVSEELRRFYREPVVQIVVTDYRANRVCLLGEIRTGDGQEQGPGCYSLRGSARLVEFITVHGGLAATADVSQARVVRPGGEVLRLDLGEVLFKGNQAHNVLLRPGDLVWIPPRDAGRSVYYILGEVRNPGMIRAAEKLTVAEAIARAGSFSQDARRNATVVFRGSSASLQMIRVDLDRFLEQGDAAQNATLEDGDIIYVPRRFGAKLREAVRIVLPALGVVRDTAILYEVLKDDQ